MLKKTMTTVDFGGTERTEDYYFNLTKADIMEMQLRNDGGFVETVKKVVEAKNQLELTHLFKKIICASYGVLSPDGRKFVKNQQVLDDFMATQAYSDLYIELLSGDGKAAEDFVNGILPKDLTNEAAKPPVSQPGLAVLNP